MDDPVIRVLAVAPYEGMRSALLQAADAFPHLRLDVVVGDLSAALSWFARRAAKTTTPSFPAAVPQR